ncbi:unnamed protein product, partial [Vitis vinifera]|uniref:Uncharacterized protein n=1 Tax=Vitis vinifera TaxID=29760 RepID=E0CQL0_VITVI
MPLETSFLPVLPPLLQLKFCCKEEVIKNQVDGWRKASTENEFDQQLIQACIYKDASRGIL